METQLEPQKRLSRAVALLRQHGYTISGPEKRNSSDATAIGALRLERSGVATYDGKPLALTAFQFLVLWTLMESRGAWCSRDQIRKVLWIKGDPERRSLSVHVHRVRRKLLELAGRNLIVSSRKKGYRFAVEALEDG